MALLSIGTVIALAYPGFVVITHILPEKAISVILSVIFCDTTISDAWVALGNI